MPKVYLSENERIIEKLVSWTYGEMKRQQIPLKVIAEEMDISSSALCQKLKKRRVSFEDFLTIVRVLQPDTEDLMWLIGRRGK